MVSQINNLWVPRVTSKNKIAGIKAYIKTIIDTKGEQSAAHAIREICKQDLFYLCYEVLGYKDLVEPLHDDLCDFIETCERNNKTNA